MEKYYIDTSYYNNNNTGISAYIYTLLECLNLSKIAYEKKEITLSNKVRLKGILFILWQNTFLYFMTLFNKPRGIIFPAFTMPYFTHKNIRYITVIHDLGHLRKGELIGYGEFIYNFTTNIAAKKATTIVTVSNTIKNELIEKLKIEPNRIKVVYNAIAPHFINYEDNFEILKKYGIEDKKYILSVATLDKRKNIPALIQAFESISDKYPDIKLVLVGGIGNENRDKLSNHYNVVFTGYAKNEEIPVLYKHALMNVFPSVYEGFGTPVVEAQYTGTPLICSDIPVFREVAGEGAEFCTTDSKGIAEKIEYLINNEQRRKELSEIGKVNVKRYDIEKIVQQLKKAIYD